MMDTESIMAFWHNVMLKKYLNNRQGILCIIATFFTKTLFEGANVNTAQYFNVLHSTEQFEIASLNIPQQSYLTATNKEQA